MALVEIWNRIIGRPAAGGSRRRRDWTRRPRLEALEDRLCPSGGYLVVGSFDNNSVLRYDESTGAFVDQFDPHNLANLKNPLGGVFGRDGNLYVSSGIFSNGNNTAVLQYNGTTGAFQSVFASQNVTSPRGVLFGPDGNLYVADGNTGPGSVERFDGKTGAFLNYFVAPGSGGLAHPINMVFGPDGTNDGKLDLYVGAGHAGSILRYDGTTGAPLPAPGQSGAVFVPPGSGGLDTPQMMVFGPDGNLYVASGNYFTSSNGPFYSGNFPPGAVLRYDGATGAFLGTFVTPGSGGLANPSGLLFGPDPSGNGKTDLYVASAVLNAQGHLKADAGTSEVLRYDATTGAFLGTFVTPDSGGLRFPSFMTFTETDPTTLNYDGATTATAGTLLAQPASSTLLAPVLASPPSGSSSFIPAAVPVSLADAPSPTAAAAVTSPALPLAQALLFAPSLANNVPLAGPDADSPPPARASTSAADQVFASLGAELSSALFGEDLALAGGVPMV